MHFKKIRLRPISNALRSKLSRAKSLADAAVDVQVLEEPHTEPASPLAVLPAALDRVTGGVPGHTTAAEELAGAKAEYFEHAEVVRYVLPDCLVHHGGVEYRGGFLVVSSKRTDRFVMSDIASAGKVHFCMSFLSHHYFGHWLADACATAMLAGNGEEIMLHDRPDWPDAAQYARHFDLATAPPTIVHVNELSIYSDYSLGMLKQQRYAAMKSRLRETARLEEVSGRHVYLRRGASGVARLVAGEDALCARLSAEGFEIVDVLTNDFHDRYRKLAAASVVVSMDGSHIMHASFAMDAGGALVTLIPSDRFTMVHRGYSHAFGLRYGCVIAQPSENGYVVSAEEVLKTVEMVA